MPRLPPKVYAYVQKTTTCSKLLSKFLHLDENIHQSNTADDDQLTDMMMMMVVKMMMVMMMMVLSLKACSLAFTPPSYEMSEEVSRCLPSRQLVQGRYALA